MCNDASSGWGSGFHPTESSVPTAPIGNPRAPALGAALAALLTLAACGPRADDSGGGVDLGAKPAIIDRLSDIPTPTWSIDGADVTFPVTFKVRALDQDANMRWVEIDVLYLDTCGGGDQRVALTEDLDPVYWARVDITVDDSTTEAVRVPQNCYPVDNLFEVLLRVRDSRGNLSNLLKNQIQVGSGQGGTP